LNKLNLYANNLFPNSDKTLDVLSIIKNKLSKTIIDRIK